MVSRQFTSLSIVRLIIPAIGLLLCLWGFWNAGRSGLSRLLSKYALATTATATPLITPADEAAQLTPNDPEAHFSRAQVLWSGGLISEAGQEYERATSLRPRDYYLWMMLGTARDQVEDEKGALAALAEAVRMAPFYAKPRWQYGNVLFRAGQREEAFKEMRRAALSDQTFLPNMIDLAWGASNNDPVVTEQLIQPERKQWRVALARFFARHGRPAESLKLYRAAGTLAETERRLLISELLAAKGFAEAYEVWAAVGNAAQGQAPQSGLAHITNGSFETQLSFDETGFGWQFERSPDTLQFSLDTAEPRAGSFSLRLDWNGNAPANTPVTTQLVLVEPNTRYQLSFAVRTKEIVSAGLPLLVVIDKSSSDNRVLKTSELLPKGNSNWQDYAVDFTTGSDTRAVLISLQREACGPDPCPIFGQLWLDNFSLRKP